jgi:hypothetical protein
MLMVMVIPQGRRRYAMDIVLLVIKQLHLVRQLSFDANANQLNTDGDGQGDA